MRSYKLVFLTPNIGNIHVVGRRREIFQLLAGENIDGNQMDFGMSVLAGLGSRHFNDLARAAFDNYVAVFPQCRTLHGEGQGGASIGALEGVLLMLWDC